MQSASATPGTTTASVSVLFSGAQGGGDLNVVVASWNDSTSTIQSATNSIENTYGLTIGPTTGMGKRQAIYYAKNIPSGSNTITVGFNQAASSTLGSWSIAEWIPRQVRNQGIASRSVARMVVVATGNCTKNFGRLVRRKAYRGKSGMCWPLSNVLMSLLGRSTARSRSSLRAPPVCC